MRISLLPTAGIAQGHPVNFIELWQWKGFRNSAELGGRGTGRRGLWEKFFCFPGKGHRSPAHQGAQMELKDTANGWRTHGIQRDYFHVAWRAKCVSGISGKHSIQTHNYIASLKDSCVQGSQEQNKHTCGLAFFLLSNLISRSKLYRKRKRRVKITF